MPIPEDSRLCDWMWCQGLPLMVRFLSLGYLEAVVLFTETGSEETQGVMQILS